MIWAALGWHLVVMVVGAVAMAWDKRRARGDGRRVSERGLIGLALMGGWPTMVWVGRRIRHKTAKTSFRIKFGCAAVVHLTVVAMLIGWAATSG